MRTIKELDAEKIRNALAALEQSFGYYVPLSPNHSEIGEDRQNYFEYYPAA